MKRTALFLLYLLTSIISFSQSGFTKGFIVDLKGDTTTGYLKKDVYYKLAQSVQYKSGINSEDISALTIRDVQSFGFEEGNVFQAITYNDALDSNKVKSVFAVNLLDGYFQLFAIANTDYSSNYFIRSKSDSGYFLYNGIPVNMNGNGVTGNYVNTLFFLSHRSDKRIPDMSVMERLPFNEKSIIKYVKQLNDDIDPVATIVRYKKPKSQVKLIGYAGGMYWGTLRSALNFQLQARITMPDRNRKISLNTGLSYMKNRKSKLTKSYTAAYTPYYKKTDYITEIGSIPVTLQYNFTEGIIQPYLYWGISVGYKYDNNIKGERGLQSNFGLANVGGAGVEIYPVKRLIIKADWRYELVIHNPVLGIAYRFH